MRVLVPSHADRAAERSEHVGRMHAAVLVVDAEGSTDLSVRLQSFGNKGAESLADVLAAIFEPMVENVMVNEGFVAEFAGDGIVALFPGDGATAVTRASTAAMGIMGDITMSGALVTPDGESTLVPRSIIAYGEITWELWAASRPDAPQDSAYAYTGRPIAEARGGEAITPGGVLSVAPSAISLLSRDTKTEPLSDGFFEIAIEDRQPGRSPIPRRHTAQHGHRFFPLTLQDLAHRGEFRNVVATFLELRMASVTENAKSMHHVLESLQDWLGYLCDVVQAESGQGSLRVFVMWGAPTSHEHDIGYSLRFLADIREKVGHPVRAGVTRSVAFAGFVGTEEQASYTAIGSGVNLAARMCHAAPWGEILVDQDISDRLDDSWKIRSLGDLDYRGFTEPIRTSVVDDVPPARTPDRHDDVMIGRQTELDRLEDFLAPLWAGRPVGTVGVSGAAGIGKSRLVADLRARLMARDPQPVWLEAQADEIRSQPLATLSDALFMAFGRGERAESSERLADYIATVASDAPELATELERGRLTFGDLLGVPADRLAVENLDARTRFENAVLAITNLIRAEARQAPVVLSIVDAQWIDDASAEIVRRAISELKKEPVAVIVETRDPSSGLEPQALIELEPLDATAITELSRLRLGSPASPALVDMLTVRSDGNPFFLRQLLDYFDRNRQLELRDDGWHATEVDTDLPVDSQRLLVSRIDELGPETRRAVQVGAVLGREIDLDLLRSMVPDPDALSAHVADGVSAGIWKQSDDGHLVFLDHLVRDAAYGMLLGSDVRAIHGSAADAMERFRSEDPEFAAELAHHQDRAGRAADAALTHLVAGREAARRFANATALEHFGRVVDLTPETQTDQRINALTEMFDVYDVTGDRDAQESTLDSMAVIEGSPETNIQIATLWARLLFARGDYTDADVTAVRALNSVADSETTPQVGSLVFIRGQLARHVGRADDASGLATQARTIFSDANDSRLVAMVDDFLGGLAFERGNFDEAASLHRSAADTFRELGRPIEEIRALNNLGSVVIAIGDYSSARSIHEKGATRSHEIGYRMGEGDHLDNVGGTAWAVGDFDLAIEKYSEALSIRRDIDDAWGVAISSSNLGGVSLAMGNTNEALRWYREALEIDQHIGRRRGEAFDLHGIGLSHLDLGHYNLAIETLSKAASIRSEIGEEHLANESHVACAVALKRRGDIEDASDLVRAAMDAEGDGMFEGAVETTATLLRCVEVLEEVDRSRAAELRSAVATRVAERSSLISDPEHRASYLRVDAHQRATGGAGVI